MPGAFAHITVVNAAKEPSRLEKAGVPRPVRRSIARWSKFCELGAVSPDYPYLTLRDEAAQEWADVMHYERTGELLQTGVRRARAMKGVPAEKATAWLLGYASHVFTDVTIHPVVEKKVGPYRENKLAHRVCEMHQDSYIYQRFQVGELRASEHLKAGVRRCEDAGTGKLDADVVGFWCDLLEETHPARFARHRPDPDHWHRGFIRAVDGVAEEGGRMPGLVEAIAERAGFVYPAVANVDPAYIHDLATPHGRMPYDAVFDLAVRNVLSKWVEMASALIDDGPRELAASLPNCNLDSGRNSVTNELLFWTEHA